MKTKLLLATAHEAVRAGHSRCPSPRGFQRNLVFLATTETTKLEQPLKRPWPLAPEQGCNSDLGGNWQMQHSAPTDGFRLAYERSGSGAPVLLLHGWPGDHTDWDQLVPSLTDVADVLRPDLRGFGASDKHKADPEKIYSGHGQARVVVALMDELKIKDAVVAAYDVGSLVSQTIAAMRPIS